MAENKEQGEITLDTPDEKELKKYTLKLSTPLKYNGEEYDSLNFDFYSLSGNDALSIEDEMAMTGKMVMTPTLSGEFMTRLAARASQEKIGEDGLRRLPISDFLHLRSRVRGFLLALELR